MTGPAEQLARELAAAVDGRPGWRLWGDVAVYQPEGATAQVHVRAVLRPDSRGRYLFHAAIVEASTAVRTAPQWNAVEAVRWAEETKLS